MEQTRLKDGGLLALIVLLSAVPPLSTDMFMPALPQIAQYFDVSSSVASFSVTEFFIGMGLGMLFLGPVSDKFGRKPVLIASIAAATLFAILSATSNSMWFLLSVRFLQAVGSGGMVTLGMALVKDSFRGLRMGRALALVTAIGTLAPMIAPVIGAGLLAFAGWRCSFYVLAVLFVIALIGTLLLDETLPKEDRTPGSILQPVKHMFSIALDSRFILFLAVGSLAMGPFMTYLAVSSFIYTGVFGTSATMFSIFFAISAAVSTIGALYYMKHGSPNYKKSVWICIIGSFVSALLVATVGRLSAVAFLLVYAPYATIENYFRPMVSNVLLASRDSDVGAASSLINFLFTMIGALIMVVGSIQLGDYVNSLAVSMMSWIFIAGVIWLIVWRKGLLLSQPDQ